MPPRRNLQRQGLILGHPPGILIFPGPQITQIYTDKYFVIRCLWLSSKKMRVTWIPFELAKYPYALSYRILWTILFFVTPYYSKRSVNISVICGQYYGTVVGLILNFWSYLTKVYSLSVFFRIFEFRPLALYSCARLEGRSSIVPSSKQRIFLKYG